mmetsp:Transcript_18421/g.41993  ORF Transcript_18421/g.41993 Transcript_18421/m.41993 type:complete len:91 (+) Transcript_18421:601-873(+)
MEQMDMTAMWVWLVLRVRKVPKALKVQLVRLDRLVLREMLAALVRLDLMAHKVLKEFLALLVCLAQKAPQGRGPSGGRLSTIVPPLQQTR